MLPLSSQPEPVPSLVAWHKPQWRFLLKSISLVITLTFVIPYLTWAFEPMAPKAGQILFNNQPVEIPANLGTVQETFQGQNQLVVFVQDLHCNYEVQNNIAQMIHLLGKNLGLKLVTVEGDSTPLDAGYYRAFPDEKIRHDAAHYFVREGEVTGPELYAITGANTFTLQGVENAKLYRANHDTVMKLLNDESQGFIYDLREALNGLKAGIYNEELKTVDAQNSAYRENHLSLFKYSLWLVGYAQKQHVSLAEYPALGQYLSRKMDEYGDVDADALFNELDQLDRAVRARLYTQTDQRTLDSLLHRTDIMEKLVNISATPAELAEFRNLPQAFAIRTFQDFISQHGDGQTELDPEVSRLDQYMDLAREFYQVADQRSRALADNVQQQMKMQHADVCMLVTGGYHCAEISAQLRQKNISYICVKPRLTRQDVLNPYFSLLRGRKTPLEKLLAQNQNIFKPESRLPTLRLQWNAATLLERAAELALKGKTDTALTEAMQNVWDVMAPGNNFVAQANRVTTDGKTAILPLPNGNAAVAGKADLEIAQPLVEITLESMRIAIVPLAVSDKVATRISRLAEVGFIAGIRTWFKAQLRYAFIHGRLAETLWERIHAQLMAKLETQELGPQAESIKRLAIAAIDGLEPSFEEAYLAELCKANMVKRVPMEENPSYTAEFAEIKAALEKMFSDHDYILKQKDPLGEQFENQMAFIGSELHAQAKMPADIYVLEDESAILPEIPDDIRQLGIFVLFGKIFIIKSALDKWKEKPGYLGAAVEHETIELVRQGLRKNPTEAERQTDHMFADLVVRKATRDISADGKGISSQDLVQAAGLGLANEIMAAIAFLTTATANDETPEEISRTLRARDRVMGEHIRELFGNDSKVSYENIIIWLSQARQGKRESLLADVKAKAISVIRKKPNDSVVMGTGLLGIFAGFYDLIAIIIYDTLKPWDQNAWTHYDYKHNFIRIALSLIPSLSWLGFSLFFKRRLLKSAPSIIAQEVVATLEGNVRDHEVARIRLAQLEPAPGQPQLAAIPETLVEQPAREAEAAKMASAPVSSAIRRGFIHGRLAETLWERIHAQLMAKLETRGLGPQAEIITSLAIAAVDGLEPSIEEAYLAELCKANMVNRMPMEDNPAYAAEFIEIKTALEKMFGNHDYLIKPEDSLREQYEQRMAEVGRELEEGKMPADIYVLENESLILLEIPDDIRQLGIFTLFGKIFIIKKSLDKWKSKPGFLSAGVEHETIELIRQSLRKNPTEIERQTDHMFADLVVRKATRDISADGKGISSQDLVQAAELGIANEIMAGQTLARQTRVMTLSTQTVVNTEDQKGLEELARKVTNRLYGTKLSAEHVKTWRSQLMAGDLTKLRANIEKNINFWQILWSSSNAVGVFVWPFYILAVGLVASHGGTVLMGNDMFDIANQYFAYAGFATMIGTSALYLIRGNRKKIVQGVIQDIQENIQNMKPAQLSAASQGQNRLEMPEANAIEANPAATVQQIAGATEKLEQPEVGNAKLSKDPVSSAIRRGFIHGHLAEAFWERIHALAMSDKDVLQKFGAAAALINPIVKGAVKLEAGLEHAYLNAVFRANLVRPVLLEESPAYKKEFSTLKSELSKMLKTNNYTLKNDDLGSPSDYHENPYQDKMAHIQNALYSDNEMPAEIYVLEDLAEVIPQLSDDIRDLGVFTLFGKIYITKKTLDSWSKEKGYLSAGMMHEIIELVRESLRENPSPFDRMADHTYADTVVRRLTADSKHKTGISSEDLIQAADLGLARNMMVINDLQARQNPDKLALAQEMTEIQYQLKRTFVGNIGEILAHKGKDTETTIEEWLKQLRAGNMRELRENVTRVVKDALIYNDTPNKPWYHSGILTYGTIPLFVTFEIIIAAVGSSSEVAQWYAVKGFIGYVAYLVGTSVLGSRFLRKWAKRIEPEVTESVIQALIAYQRDTDRLLQYLPEQTSLPVSVVGAKPEVPAEVAGAEKKPLLLEAIPAKLEVPVAPAVVPVVAAKSKGNGNHDFSAPAARELHSWTREMTVVTAGAMLAILSLATGPLAMVLGGLGIFSLAFWLVGLISTWGWGAALSALARNNPIANSAELPNDLQLDDLAVLYATRPGLYWASLGHESVQINWLGRTASHWLANILMLVPGFGRFMRLFKNSWASRVHPLVVAHEAETHVGARAAAHKRVVEELLAALDTDARMVRFPRGIRGLGLALLGVAGCFRSAMLNPHEGTGGAIATPGTVSTGGIINTGGIFSTGGATGFGGKATGGTSATGGQIATGGTSANGGQIATGSSAAGGTNVTGGTSATGGTNATGGQIATGGMSSTNGGQSGATSDNTGGVKGTGGMVAAGGAISTGGTTAGTGTTAVQVPARATVVCSYSKMNADITVYQDGQYYYFVNDYFQKTSPYYITKYPMRGTKSTAFGLQYGSTDEEVDTTFNVLVLPNSEIQFAYSNLAPPGQNSQSSLFTCSPDGVQTSQQWFPIGNETPQTAADSSVQVTFPDSWWEGTANGTASVLSGAITTKADGSASITFSYTAAGGKKTTDGPHPVTVTDNGDGTKTYTFTELGGRMVAITKDANGQVMAETNTVPMDAGAPLSWWKNVLPILAPLVAIFLALVWGDYSHAPLLKWLGVEIFTAPMIGAVIAGHEIGHSEAIGKGARIQFTWQGAKTIAPQNRPLTAEELVAGGTLANPNTLFVIGMSAVMGVIGAFVFAPLMYAAGGVIVFAIFTNLSSHFWGDGTLLRQMYNHPQLQKQGWLFRNFPFLQKIEINVLISELLVVQRGYNNTSIDKISRKDKLHLIGDIYQNFLQTSAELRHDLGDLDKATDDDLNRLLNEVLEIGENSSPWELTADGKMRIPRKIIQGFCEVDPNAQQALENIAQYLGRKYYGKPNLVVDRELVPEAPLTPPVGVLTPVKYYRQHAQDKTVVVSAAEIIIGVMSQLEYSKCEETKAALEQTLAHWQETGGVARMEDAAVVLGTSTWDSLLLKTLSSAAADARDLPADQARMKNVAENGAMAAMLALQNNTVANIPIAGIAPGTDRVQRVEVLPASKNTFKMLADLINQAMDQIKLTRNGSAIERYNNLLLLKFVLEKLTDEANFDPKTGMHALAASRSVDAEDLSSVISIIRSAVCRMLPAAGQPVALGAAADVNSHQFGQVAGVVPMRVQLAGGREVEVMQPVLTQFSSRKARSADALADAVEHKAQAGFKGFEALEVKDTSTSGSKLLLWFQRQITRFGPALDKQLVFEREFQQNPLQFLRDLNSRLVMFKLSRNSLVQALQAQLDELLKGISNNPLGRVIGRLALESSPSSRAEMGKWMIRLLSNREAAIRAQKESAERLAPRDPTRPAALRAADLQQEQFNLELPTALNAFAELFANQQAIPTVVIATKDNQEFRVPLALVASHRDHGNVGYLLDKLKLAGWDRNTSAPTLQKFQRQSQTVSGSA